MSKVTLAFGSFALGVAATLFALSGSPALTSAQGRITPQRSIPPLAVGSGAGIPTVPVITQHYSDFGVSATNLAYDVNGSECVNTSVLKTVTLKEPIKGSFGITK